MDRDQSSSSSRSRQVHKENSSHEIQRAKDARLAEMMTEDIECLELDLEDERELNATLKKEVEDLERFAKERMRNGRRRKMYI